MVMRGIVLVLLCFVALVPLRHAHAVFYNDSNVIEIGDGTPPEPSESGSGGDIGGSTAGGAQGLEQGSTGSGGTSTGSSGGTASGETSSFGGTSGGGSSGSAGDAGAGGASGGNTQGGSTGAGTGTEEELIELLLSEGALEGVLGSGSGDSEGADASGSGGGAFDADSSLGGFGAGSVLSVSVSGSKVRDALRGKYDLQDILDGWRGKAGKKYGAREYGLMAASTALRDGNVEAVLFTASAFEITYRSRGYLLAVIPWSFPVRVSIVPEAQALEERVKVKLPWYRFFVREFFTADGLRREIDDAIAAARKANIATDTDGTALLFGTVSDFLKRKVGTIQESILLGTPAS